MSDLQQNPIHLSSYKVRTQKQKNMNGSGAQTKKPQHLYVVSLILAGFSDESPLLTLAERTKLKSFFRDVLLVPYFSPNTLVKVNPCTPVPMTW